MAGLLTLGGAEIAYAEAAEDIELSSGYEAEAESYPEDVDMGVALDGEEESEELPTVSYEILPIYFLQTDTDVTCPIYYINGVKDLPYMNLSDFKDLLYAFRDEGDAYELEYEADGSVAMITRENGYSMLVDFEAETISFDDYDGFMNEPGDNSLLDLVSHMYTDENDDPILIERVEKGSYDRYGKELVLDLAAYKIKLYWSSEDELYLVPMQTLMDFTVSLKYGMPVLYNTKGVYFGGAEDYGFDSGLTPLGESYYSAESAPLSDELAWYGYCELCLVLDQMYGLKESHDIESFDKLFTEIGYRNDLMSTDSDVRDGALIDFIDYYLDDMHSGSIAPSYLTEEAETIEGNGGISAQRDRDAYGLYSDAREEADHEIKAYEEVGNTAYITFDGFNMLSPAADYYEDEADPEMDPASDNLDTISLIIYAHKQITRKDSPIENVVLDLSLNGGGQIDAAVFVAAWYLGEASMSVRSSMTGAISTGTYLADTNLDGVFDEKDSIKDKNLYCLIGPLSFSCGNLVPNILRSSGRVTLLGKMSGGGSCSVQPLSTAHGAMFKISSPNRMSYVKNGSYYDTDTGIEPDCVIVKPENFYDRKGLTDYIKQLF